MNDYRDEIIDHYKYPRNFGVLSEPKITVKENNASCGDMVEIYARLDKERRISEMMWKGVGCAISTAAASMLSEKARGMNKEDLERLGEKGVVELLGGSINAGRMKCATLAFRALMKVFA